MAKVKTAKIPKVSTKRPKVLKGGHPPASGEKKIKMKSAARNKELDKWPPKAGKKS